MSRAATAAQDLSNAANPRIRLLMVKKRASASSPSVPEPVSVRYGWANSPPCNLFNAENLPASPFTSLH